MYFASCHHLAPMENLCTLFFLFEIIMFMSKIENAALMIILLTIVSKCTACVFRVCNICNIC